MFQKKTQKSHTTQSDENKEAIVERSSLSYKGGYIEVVETYFFLVMNQGGLNNNSKTRGLMCP